MRLRAFSPFVAAFLLAALPALAAAPPKKKKPAAAPPEKKPEVVALIAGKPVTAAEVEAAAATRLATLRQQEYDVKRQALEEIIGRRLLEQAAAARQISAEELTRVEVEGKATPVTEPEKKDAYEKNKARFANVAEAEALTQIEAGLRQQRVRERRAAYLRELRAKAGVKVMLDPPRQSVAAGDNPARGPANAPVTLIEFSDFQCPFCARVGPTLKKLEETYPGQIRLVFRDLPLLNLHKNAGHAAEAAACANEQGKFWAMHDRLFANQGKLAPAELKTHAAELGLDTAAFDACLDSGKYTAEWQKDAEEAARLGLTGTPAFFINGRLLVGARPYEDFAAVVEDELERAGRKTSRTTPPGER
jgi:protein-disulfide isomerase